VTATLTLDAGEPVTATAPSRGRTSAERRRSGAGIGSATVPAERSRLGGASPTPALRISPVPRCEPLSDEERRSGLVEVVDVPATRPALPSDLATGVQVRRGSGGRADAGASATGTLAGAGAPVHRTAAGARRVGGEVGSIPPPSLVGVVSPDLSPAAHVPPPPAINGMDLRIAARRLLSACVEVLGGFRPVAQLRAYCAPERFDAIANRLLRPVSSGRGHGATRTSLIMSRLSPPRPGRPARVRAEDRITVRRVQICDVMDGIAELVVVMSRHNKVWAMTLRMERNHGRWLCKQLDVL
jgi:hypothetical protein